MLEEKWASIKLDNSNMEKLNLNFFYQLGSQLGPLTKMDVQKIDRLQIMRHAFPLQRSVEILLGSYPALTVCRSVADDLITKINAIGNWLVAVETKDFTAPDESMDSKFKEVITEAKEFETVLTAEMQTLATYHIDQKGIYSTSDLIAHAEKTLSQTVLVKIDHKVVDEIRQSGRCLAFDNPTAAGFHILRATEAILHQYYVVVCKVGSKAKPLDNWGAYISALQKSPDADVKKVVAMLQQIKDLDRNLIMHPEVVLSPDEAFDLFETAKAAIITMAKKLPEAKKNEAKKSSTQKT